MGAFSQLIFLIRGENNMFTNGNNEATFKAKKVLAKLERQLVEGIHYLDEFLDEMEEMTKNEEVAAEWIQSPDLLLENTKQLYVVATETKRLRIVANDHLNLLREFSGKFHPGKVKSFLPISLEKIYEGVVHAMNREIQKIMDHKEKHKYTLDELSLSEFSADEQVIYS